MAISGAGNKEVAAVMDHPAQEDQVAGFVVSREANPGGISAALSALLLRFSLIWRYDFKRTGWKNSIVLDAEGYPLDSGYLHPRRLVAVGALASSLRYQDPKRATGQMVDDLSNGTNLAVRCSTVRRTCDAERVGQSAATTLDWRPLSVSLKVVRDGKHLARSRLLGFDYRTSDNSLVFPGIKDQPGAGVLTSYYRWGWSSCGP